MDGVDTGGVSCFSLGYAGGRARCGADCELDLSECSGVAWARKRRGSTGPVARAMGSRGALAERVSGLGGSFRAGRGRARSRMLLLSHRF